MKSFQIYSFRYINFFFFFFQLFEYERLVDVLLYSVHGMTSESFVQRIGIYLLNSLACQVDGHQKVRLGELGAINVSF